MNLLEYLKTLTAEARATFAAKCGTSTDYLLQIAYGQRKPKVGLAVAIERESAGQVTCEALLPDVDWKYLRAPGPAQAVGT